jgi:hypothetical protein
MQLEKEAKIIDSIWNQHRKLIFQLYNTNNKKQTKIKPKNKTMCNNTKHNEQTTISKHKGNV